MKSHEKQEEQRNEKRRYEAPEVQTEEVFETLALTCTKVDLQQCPTPTGGAVARS
jgi:hypothetical protein